MTTHEQSHTTEEKKGGRPVLTTGHGQPVSDNRNSLTAGGVGGPILLQDIHLIDKLAHFDRERIPERVVHAKGAGAYGFFEVTQDVTQFCKAKFLNKVGKKTPVFVRFSTVGGEKGSSDCARDPRGFAIKHYTEEGVYDMVGNNTPIFFIRDPINFPDFIHTQKRNPQTNLPDPNAFWDFASQVPESVHQFMFLFSDRGTPASYRHMNGYSSHTFKWVNSDNKAFWVKLRYTPVEGVRNFTRQQAALGDADHHTRDLFNHIAGGNSAVWKAEYQIMPFEDAATYRWNIFDITKVWPTDEYPRYEYGRLVLNRNPQNYFAETEQACFSPGHLVPGIEPSPDRMLQARLFSYPDTHRHRVGANYLQLPVNASISRVSNQQRDGPMAFNNYGSEPNYYPNTHPGSPEVSKDSEIKSFHVDGDVGRHTDQTVGDRPPRAPRPVPNSSRQRLDESDKEREAREAKEKEARAARDAKREEREKGVEYDFVQPHRFWNEVLTAEEKDRLVDNFATHLVNAHETLRRKQINDVFRKVDVHFAKRVEDAVAALIGGRH